MNQVSGNATMNIKVLSRTEITRRLTVRVATALC